MKINILGIVKGVSELAVSAGVGTVVGNLVKATTPYDLTKTQKVVVAIGGYSLGAVLGDLSAKYISEQIDGYAERVSSIIHPSEETIEDAKEFADAVHEAQAELNDLADSVVEDVKDAVKAPKTPKPVTEESE